MDTKMTAGQEWAKGWPIVLASFIGIGLCLSPLPYYAAITIGPEFAKSFAWDRVTIQTGFIFMTAGVLIGAPIAGSLTDRFGARRVLLPAIIALGLLTGSFAFMNANPLVFYSIFYFTAVLGAGTLPMTWSKAIVNNFDKSRGLALGIALTGTGFYGFLAPPFIRRVIDGVDWSQMERWFTSVPLTIWLAMAATYFLIYEDKKKTAYIVITALILYNVIAPIFFAALGTQSGWRAAYISVGALPLLYSLPLALAVFSDKKEEGALAKKSKTTRGGLKGWLTPLALILGVFAIIMFALKAIGVAGTSGLMLVMLMGLIFYEVVKDKSTPDIDLPGLSLTESVKDYRFWVILFSFFLLGACVSGIIANTVFILMDKGYSPQLASSPIAGLGLIGFSVIIGRLLGGIIVDFVWAPLVAFIFMGVPAIGCYLLMQDLPQIYNSIAIILVGIAAGVEFDLMAYLVSRYLGMKAYGRIYSFIYVAFGIGSGTAPALFNVIKGDAVDYNTVLSFAIVGFIVGAGILLTLGKYRDFGG